MARKLNDGRTVADISVKYMTPTWNNGNGYKCYPYYLIQTFGQTYTTAKGYDKWVISLSIPNDVQTYNEEFNDSEYNESGYETLTDVISYIYRTNEERIARAKM